jgi:hypothetical protein
VARGSHVVLDVLRSDISRVIERGVFAGVIGAAVAVLLAAGARALGVDVDVEILLGTLTGRPPRTGAWVTGVVVWVALGGAVGLLYAICFERVIGRAGMRAGLAVGAMHGLVTGLALALVPPLHRLVPEQLPAPGAFMSSLGGAGVVVHAVLHLVYGAVVGEMYGPVRGAAASPAAGLTPARPRGLAARWLSRGRRAG